MSGKNSNKCNAKAVALGVKHQGSKVAARGGERSTRPAVAASKQGGLKMIPAGTVGNCTTFPNRMTKTFATSGTITLTGDGIGSIQRYTLSMNSLFDPDVGGAGHSPRYYDTLVGADSSTAPYGKYNVERSRLKISFMNGGSINSALADIGVYVRSDEMAPINSIDELFESTNAVSTVLGSGYSGNGTVEFAFEITPAKMAALQDQQDILDDVDNLAWYNSDPAKEIYADVMYRPLISSSTNTIYVRWTIEMDAVLFSLNEPTTSLVRRIGDREHKPKRPLVSGPVKTESVASEAHPKGCFCTKCRSPCAQ